MRTLGDSVDFRPFHVAAVAGGLLGVLLCAPARAETGFKIRYGNERYLGVSLGYDGGEPIKLERWKALDLNQDGLDDLAFNSTAHSLDQIKKLPFKAFVSNGTTLVDRTSSVFPSGPRTQFMRDIHAADLNGDRRLDLFLSNQGTEKISPFPGEQNGLLLSVKRGRYADVSRRNLPQETDFSHGSGLGDFDLDGDVDIFVNNLGDDEPHPSVLLFNNGRGKFSLVGDTWNQIGDRFPPNPGCYWSHVMDMDSDGDPDIYCNELRAAGSDDAIHYFENDGKGRFRLSDELLGIFSTSPDSVVQDSFSTDIDRDGDQDLLLYDNGGSGPTGIQLLLSRGDGSFDNGWDRFEFYPDVFGAPMFTVVDLDGDGDHDIFVNRFNNDFSGEAEFGLLNDGTGRFSRIPDHLLPPVRPGYAALDVNGDGLTDFLSDQTYQSDWAADPKKQFKLMFARLDVAVDRTGWENTDDKIAGGSKNDRLSGLGGDDHLIGNGGIDTLIGGPGRDLLRGGAARDLLNGADGPDTYRFMQSDDLRRCPACDLVKTFQQGLDTIDLAQVDAVDIERGDQAFSFIGRQPFSRKAGQLRYQLAGNSSRLQADTSGDGTADFEIEVTGKVRFKPGDIRP